MRSLLKRPWTALVVAVLVASILAPATGASLTPAGYRAKANAACTKAKRQTNALGRPKTEVGLARYVVRFVGIGHRLLTTLRGLDPPRSLRNPHARAVATIATELEVLEGAVQRMHEGQHPRVALAPTEAPIAALARREDAAWRQAGVRVCAED